MDERLQQLLDKQEIHEVLTRWSRGLDRGDVDLMASVFHDDVRVVQGGRKYDAALDGVNPALDYAKRHEVFRCHLHYNMNELIDLDGDVARAETYLFATLVLDDDDGVEKLSMFGIRHADRLERRDGTWKIADRVSSIEWWAVIDTCRTGLGVDPAMIRLGELGSKSRSDPSYNIP